MTAFVVHTSTFSTLKILNLFRLERHETYNSIPLSLLQISDLYFFNVYEPLNV